MAARAGRRHEASFVPHRTYVSGGSAARSRSRAPEQGASALGSTPGLGRVTGPVIGTLLSSAHIYHSKLSSRQCPEILR
jgi:hypothetical protein